ncbi:MAG: ankyrin repeat domain-containing protein [Gemmatimonadetes bacterium]|nr:ankyrin repeat domain-containing protein [Gemmatimonadota bacterium]
MPQGATRSTAPAASTATAAPNAASRTAADTVKRTPADSARLAAENRSLSYGELVGKSGGLTPLLFAVRQGHSASVLALLAAGADVNQVSAGDHTSPLLMATINGQFDLAMVLLGKGAKPTLASDAGTTPLYATINVQWAPKSLYPQPTAQLQQETGHLALMEALIKGGADVNARLNKHLWFMSYNFDLLGVNSEGATPFWRAAYGLDIPAMKLLLANGADPKVATKKPAGRLRGDDAPPAEGAAPKDESGLPPIPVGGPGVFPIHAASGVGYGEGYAANSHRHAPDAWIPAVKYLIEAVGADVNARDHNGFTPLHHAAARGDNALIEYLLSKGADIHAVARRGQTVADMANGPVQRIPPFVETVKLLEKLGSKNSNKCKSC